MYEQQPKNSESSSEKETKIVESLVRTWEALGSGTVVPSTMDKQEMRQNLWASMKTAYLNDVLPNVAFTRKPGLEEAARNQEQTVEEKAKAEYDLVSDYVMQLHQVPHGYGTTPMLSKLLGYKLNCVSKAAIVAALCEENGINAKAGTISGHQVVIVEDGAGNMIYGDSNGIVGQIEPEKRTAIADDVTEYEISDEDRKKLQIPYKLLLVSSPEKGFVRSAIDNLEPSEIETYGDEDARTLRKKHADMLESEDLRGAGHWLAPELDVLHEHRWSKEDRRIELERSFSDLVMKKTFPEKELSPDEGKLFGKQLLAESRTTGMGDTILSFLTGTDENADLPEGLSADVKRYWRVLRDESQKIKEEQPEFYNQIMNRVAELLHPN